MIRGRFSYLHPVCGLCARKYLINRYLQNKHPQAHGIPHLHDVRHPQERDWQRELRTTISSYMQTGAHTGPCIGPIPAFPAVFAYMGPADGPVRALAFRGGNRSQLKSGKDTCAVYTGMATKWRFYVHRGPGTDVRWVLDEVCASYQENDAFCLYAATVYKSSLNNNNASERQFYAQVSQIRPISARIL